MVKTDAQTLDITSLSESDRDALFRQKRLLDDWTRFRETSGLPKSEADAAFLAEYNAANPGERLKRGVLYAKLKAYRERGEAALIDSRGRHGSHRRKLTPEVWDTFESFYLTEHRRGVPLCVNMTKWHFLGLRESGEISGVPEFPCADVFERRVKQIPYTVVMLERFGEKAFIGKCEPYIRRQYADIAPNDIWVGDNHTFDIALKNGGGKSYRICVTVWMDVRTRKIMGWAVTDNPCADATLLALKNGVAEHGAPKSLYTDNGREFTVYDIGGPGFRKKPKPGSELEPEQLTILKDLGIGFSAAIPRNARAKPVERAFKTIKEQFSKLFEAYTGGSVAEKPDALKIAVKTPSMMKTADELRFYFDKYIRGIYNKAPHRGEGMNGMSPDEAFAELLTERRVVPPDRLALMFMRYSRPLTVGKNGVTLTICGEKLDFFDQGLWMRHFGEKVFARYDPADLSKAYIYSADKRFICEAAQLPAMSYFADKDALKERKRTLGRATKAVKLWRDAEITKGADELEIMARQALEGVSGKDFTPDPKIIIPVFGAEVYAKASGDGIEPDSDENAERWASALEWLRLKRGGERYE